MATYSTTQTSAQESYDRISTIAAGGNFDVSDNVFAFRVGADNTTLNINDSVVLTGPGYNDIYPCSSAIVFGDLTYDTNRYQLNGLYNATITFGDDQPIEISNTSGGDGTYSHVYGIVGNDLTFGTTVNPSVGSNVSIKTVATTTDDVSGNNVVFTAAIRNSSLSNSQKMVFTGDLNAAVSASAESGKLDSSDELSSRVNYSGTDASAYGIMANNSMSIGGSFNGSFDISAKAGDYINSNRYSGTSYARAFATAIYLKGVYGSFGNLSVNSNFAGTIRVDAEGGDTTFTGEKQPDSSAQAYGIQGGGMTVGGDFSTRFEIQAVAGKSFANEKDYGVANATAYAVSLSEDLNISGNFSVQGTVLAEGGRFATRGYESVTEAYGIYHRGSFTLQGDDTSSIQVTAKSGSVDSSGLCDGNDFSATATAWFEGNRLTVEGSSSGTLKADAFGGSIDSVYRYSNPLDANAVAYAFRGYYSTTRTFKGAYEKNLIANAVGGTLTIGNGAATASASAVGFYISQTAEFNSSVDNRIDVSAKGGYVSSQSSSSSMEETATASATGVQGQYIRFDSQVTADWNVLSQGGTAYSAGAIVAAYSAAYGLNTIQIYGSGVLGGTISVTAQGGWSSTTSGLTKRRDNGIAIGIYASDSISADGNRGNLAFTITGNVIANGEQYANGIIAKEMNLVVSGTVFAGKYNISVNASAEELNEAAAELETLLADSDANLSVLKDAVLNAQGYAIYAGTISIGTNMTYSAGKSDDLLVLNGNAKVFGNIDLTAGENSLTFADNAFFYGDLYATGGTMSVNFNLDGTENGHLFVSSGNVEFLASASATISVDVSGASEGVYYLMESENLKSIAGQNFSISYQGEEKQFSIGTQSVFDDTVRVSLRFTDETKTKLALVVEDLVDRIKPVLSPDPITAYVDGTTLSFSWSPATDNVGVVGYIVERNGDEYGVQTSGCSISNVVAGTEYTIRYCAVDAAGNRSSWSSYFSYTVPIVPPEKDTVSPTLAADSSAVIRYEGTTAYISWKPASDNVGVAGYYVEFDGKLYQTDENTFRLEVGYGLHTVRYCAYDEAGNRSDWSAVSSAELAAPEPEPTGPSLTKDLTVALTNQSYKAKFSWGKADLEKGEKLRGYEAFLDGVSLGLLKSTSYSTKELLSIGTHTFKVRAVNANGEAGEWYEESFEVKDVTAPSGKMKAVAEARMEDGRQVVDLSWEAAEDNVGVTKYLVEYGVGKNLVSYETTETSFRISGNPGEKLTVQIRAYDGSGNVSKVSKSSVTIVDKVAPDIVQNLGCVQDEAKYKATLTWDPSMDNSGTVKASGYYVTYATKEDFSDAVTKKSTKTTFSLSKLQANTTYYYKVTAYDKAKNESADSEVFSFFVKDVTPPSKPSLQVKKMNENLYALTWKTPKDNVGIAGYEVRYTTSTGDLNYPLQSWKTLENGASLKLYRAGSYIVQMCAYDTSGNMALSSVKKITVKQDMLPIYASASDLNLNFGREAEKSLGLASI